MVRYLHDLTENELRTAIIAMVKALDIHGSTRCYDLYECVERERLKAISCYEGRERLELP